MWAVRVVSNQNTFLLFEQSPLCVSRSNVGAFSSLSFLFYLFPSSFSPNHIDRKTSTWKRKIINGHARGNCYIGTVIYNDNFRQVMVSRKTRPGPARLFRSSKTKFVLSPSPPLGEGFFLSQYYISSLVSRLSNCCKRE